MSSGTPRAPSSPCGSSTITEPEGCPLLPSAGASSPFTSNNNNSSLHLGKISSSNCLIIKWQNYYPIYWFLLYIGILFTTHFH